VPIASSRLFLGQLDDALEGSRGVEEGRGVDPQEVLQASGADLLRLTGFVADDESVFPVALRFAVVAVGGGRGVLGPDPGGRGGRCVDHVDVLAFEEVMFDPGLEDPAGEFWGVELDLDLAEGFEPLDRGEPRALLFLVLPDDGGSRSPGDQSS